jgi:lysozyme family protein
MPALTFDQVFDRVIGNEGGYVNNAADPGGETNWGIAKRSYPAVDIKGLTRLGARAIYRRDFWDRLGFDAFPSALVFQLFDFAVNSGLETAVRYLQRAVGVADDGHWGAVSAAAMQAMSPTDLILRLNAERLDYLTKLANWPDAGRGWARRIAANLRYGAEDT